MLVLLHLRVSVTFSDKNLLQLDAPLAGSVQQNLMQAYLLSKLVVFKVGSDNVFDCAKCVHCCFQLWIQLDRAVYPQTAIRQLDYSTSAIHVNTKPSKGSFCTPYVFRVLCQNSTCSSRKQVGASLWATYIQFNYMHFNCTCI